MVRKTYFLGGCVGFEMIPVDKTDPREIAKLAALDVAIYPHASDLFDDGDWEFFPTIFDFAFIEMDGKTVGSIHNGPHLEWEKEDLPNPSPGCFYAAGLGILTEFRGRGIATAAKLWQIELARSQGFDRIVTYCRKSNVEMIHINEKVGFKALREIPDFYGDPDEPAVVLELVL